MNKKIQIYYDGASLEDIKNNIFKNYISGYTFNPSLFRSLEIKDYLKGCRNISELTKFMPTSLEVIADNFKDMTRQAEILSKLGNNIVVKIPIVYTNGVSTKKVIEYLIKKKIKLNITAVFTLNQVKSIFKIIKNTDTILSVFVGRIYDAGQDGEHEGRKFVEFIKKNKSNCKMLWASARQSYDVIKAKRSGFDIITLNKDLIKKSQLFGMSLKKYSILTVKQFYQDAKKSKYNF
jgi:transaldolase